MDSTYELDGVEETNERVGKGAFALVTVVKYKGTKCAAKKLHDVLTGDPGIMRDRFKRECILHCKLRHPHIVQFLGYYQEVRGLVPVTELLSTDLSRCIDRYGVLPKEISHSILHDVVLGLQYLHERSKPIIHRNLSANNVLLADDMTAKIGSFGSALVLTPSEVDIPMTPVPGNRVYLPPEAFYDPSIKYDVKLDIFSYGVLVVHMLSGQEPTNLKEASLSEAGRRQEYLQAIGIKHPLMGLIRQCLSNYPVDRPVARKIYETLENAYIPNSNSKLEVLCQLNQRERNQSMEQDFAKRFDTILNKAMSNVPDPNMGTFVSSVQSPGSETLTSNHSYLNYHLVEDTVEKFGDDELKAKMKEYHTDLKKFRKQTTISDFIAISREKHVEKLEPLREDYTELSVKFDKEGENMTMEDVERMRTFIACQLALPLHAVLFYTVEEGSIIAKFWVKTSVFEMKHNIGGARSVKLEKEDDIIELRIDDKLMNLVPLDVMDDPTFKMGFSVS